MKKILIVERDNFTAEMIQESLSHLGHQATNCIPHTTLASQLIDLEPDIVLINQAIYVKNRKLFYDENKRLSKVWIVVTSSIIQDPNLIKEIGADTFILKPFDTEILKKIIDNSCECYHNIQLSHKN